MKDQIRGRNIALAGAVLQAIFAVTMVALGTQQWTNAKSAMATAWFLLGGVLLWLMVAVLFYCRQLAGQEEAELADLAGRGEAGGGLFDRDRDLSLRPAARRLAFVERWVVPAFTLLLAGWQIIFGVLVLMALRFLVGHETIPPMAGIGQGALFSGLVALVAFLFSRYCTGMSSEPQWRPLRAAASYLLVGALACGAVLAGYLLAWWGYRLPDVGVAFAVPAVQLVLAAELLVSLVLDIYRPRVPGRERRPSFDSRLFALLAEPGKLGHSIAETLNYQFGFEVSKTWFYRLLSKALAPLLGFGVLVLLLVSSIVIVYEGRQCVVLHWGRPRPEALGPGLHLKWPWPVDTARHFDVGRVHEIRVGVGRQREPVVIKGREIRLWTQTHGQYEERDFLVAIPPERAAAGASTQPAGEAENRPPPVHIIKLVLSVRYRIGDPYKFGFGFTDAAGLLEGAAYREMIRYCASATLHTEVGGDPNRPEAIMTGGWGKASSALQQRIRRAVGPGGLDLGADVVAVELTGVHPPPEVAKDFEAVLAAERGQDITRYQAEGEANRMLASVAGDPDSALALALAIARLEQLESLANLRENPSESRRHVEGYLRHAAANLKMLRRAIRREWLLGRLGEAATVPAGAPGSTAAAAEQLRDRAGKLSDSLQDVLREVVDWDQLGRLGTDHGTPKQRLAARYALHLLDLVTIYAAPSGLDYAAATAAARRRADELFAAATGDPARQVAAAGAYRIAKEMKERTNAEAFQRELLAYKASPNLYMLDRWLDVWDELLPGMKKYVLGIPRDRVEIWMNWEREKSAFEGVFGGPDKGK